MCFISGVSVTLRLLGVWYKLEDLHQISQEMRWDDRLKNNLTKINLQS